MLFADEYDAYIIVSFVNATLVLSIGETVEEVTDSGFLGTTPTLSCSQLGDDALVQVSILSCLVFAWLLLMSILNQFPVSFILSKLLSTNNVSQGHCWPNEHSCFGRYAFLLSFM